MKLSPLRPEAARVRGVGVSVCADAPAYIYCMDTCIVFVRKYIYCICADAPAYIYRIRLEGVALYLDASPEADQFAFYCFDLYHTSPDAGERQYRSRT